MSIDISEAKNMLNSIWQLIQASKILGNKNIFNFQYGRKTLHSYPLVIIQRVSIFRPSLGVFNGILWTLMLPKSTGKVLEVLVEYQIKSQTRR